MVVAKGRECVFCCSIDRCGLEVNAGVGFFNCKYIVGISMCRLKERLFMLYQASLNSHACLVAACPNSFVCVQSNLCPLSSACFAGSELWLCRLIAF